MDRVALGDRFFPLSLSFQQCFILFPSSVTSAIPSDVKVTWH